MRRKCSFVVLCFAWLCANGALWNCVQVFAWGKMMHDYSRIMPWEMAVERTFDGTMPCKICLAVDRAKQKESQPAQRAEEDVSRVLLALNVAVSFGMPVPECDWPEVFAQLATTRTEPVPIPPPRV